LRITLRTKASKKKKGEGGSSELNHALELGHKIGAGFTEVGRVVKKRHVKVCRRKPGADCNGRARIKDKTRRKPDLRRLGGCNEPWCTRIGGSKVVGYKGNTDVNTRAFSLKGSGYFSGSREQGAWWGGSWQST